MQQNEFENVIYKMATILSCLNVLILPTFT